jgi:hypothetical protein
MALKKLITGALAAVTLLGATAFVAPAEARPHGYGGEYRGGYNNGYRWDGHHYRDRSGAIIAAGVAGLAIGAIIGSSSQPRYASPPAYGYYGPPPPRYYQPRWCTTTDWVWDPYYGQRVPVERSYRC